MSKESSKKGNISTVPVYPDPFESVLIDKSATNSFISGAGIKFLHMMCLSDPSYKVEENAPRDSFNQDDFYRTEDSIVFLRENGFIYYVKGTINAIFMNNSKNLQYIPAGLYNSSEAMLSVNGLYEDSDEMVKISEYDRLIPIELAKNFYTVGWEQFKYNVSGLNKLQYPVEEVEMLIDSNRKQYKKGVDFDIQDGMVKWNMKGSVPGLDTKSGRGSICSVRYTYMPTFFVKSVAHDIRVMPKFLIDGNYEIANRGPLVTVSRQSIFENKRNDNELDSANQEFDPDLGRKGYNNDGGDPTSGQNDGESDVKVISGSTSLEDLADGLTASGKAR